MDGRGRITQPLTWIAGLRARPPTALALHAVESRTWRRRLSRSALRFRLPRGVGLAAALLVIGGGAGYGVVMGGHTTEIVDTLTDVRDQAANAAGFRIVSVALTGNRHVSREEVLATAGVTGRASLL